MKKVFKAAAIICTALALVSCEKKGKEASAGDTLYLFNWTYYTPDSVLAKFEKEFGATFEETPAPSDRFSQAVVYDWRDKDGSKTKQNA